MEEDMLRGGPRQTRRLASGDGLGLRRGKAVPPVGGNRPIDDGTAIDAFPGIEDEEEVGKPLQHHQPFTFGTFHKPSCRQDLAGPSYYLSKFWTINVI